jgi:hypothetical protein
MVPVALTGTKDPRRHQGSKFFLGLVPANSGRVSDAIRTEAMQPFENNKGSLVPPWILGAGNYSEAVKAMKASISRVRRAFARLVPSAKGSPERSGSTRSK